MIHLSDPAAYHDKRFKNNPAKRKTMKTQLPTPGEWLHERCGQKVYTESQLRAAMVAAYEEAIEDAAKECEGMKVRAIRINYEDVYRHPANAIRKLKEIP